MIKYLLSGISLILGILLLIGYFNIISYRKDVIENSKKQELTIASLKGIIQQHKERPIEVDTMFIPIAGELEKNYEKIIEELQSKLNDTVGIAFIDNKPKIDHLVDSLSNKDLTIKYDITHLGKILNTKFAYKIHQLKTIETQIIYQDKSIMVDKPYYVPRHHLYCTGGVGINGSVFSVGLTYTDNKRLLLGANYEIAIFDEIYKYWRVKVGYRLF